MKNRKQENVLSYAILILAFAIYTIFIPTTGLSKEMKLVVDVILVGSVIYVFQKEWSKSIRLTKKSIFKTLGTIFLFWFISMLVSGLSNNLLYEFLGIENANNVAQQTVWQTNPFYLSFSMLLFSPIVEEFVFTIATKKLIDHKWLYIIASALLCGAMYVAFSSPGSYWFFISYFLQEAIWAYSYYKTDNALVPIGIHFMQNLIAIVSYMVLV